MFSSIEAIQAARKILETATPLKRDCGRQCGGACCQPDEEGKGGMLLFPGEEALYAPPPAWASLSDSTLQIVGKPLRFLTCNASCEREHRPLSCRVFPLTPLARDGSCAVALDVRAWPVCPLMGHGLEGLSREFVAAATAAAAILWENPACRAYIQTLSDQLASLASW